MGLRPVAVARGRIQVADLGKVGHLNPASGYGDWPQAQDFIARLSAAN